MQRVDGRSYNELRPVNIILDYQDFAEGSVVIEMGKTRVLCSVSVEERVPHFLRGSGKGWVTAEYSMLPRSTHTRTLRDSVAGKISGRSQEIQRLIGRSLRAVTDTTKLGERTLVVDCDVLQADGGTRTAAITGAYIALSKAMGKLNTMGIVSGNPFDSAVAAVSVGIVKNRILLDLCYDEDCNADADFNIVMTGKGDFVEVQATAEGKPYSRETLDSVLTLAEEGIQKLFKVQQDALQI